MSQNHTQLTKIGPCHSVPHLKIWIEGKHLAAAGFTPGTRYNREESESGLLLRHTPDGTGTYKVAGKGDKPIIDTSGAIVPRMFPSPITHVTVEFSITAKTIRIHA